MKIVIGVVLLLLVAGITVSASLTMYYIREDSGGDLLWNADGAYIFMKTGQRGFHTTLLRYPLVILEQYLYAPPPANADHFSETVIRVTPSAVERHIVDVPENSPGNAPSLYTPLGDQIFALCQGVLCKWADDHFERATPQEQRKLGGTNGLVADKDTQINGWSKRPFVPAPVDYHWDVEAGKEFKLSITNRVVDKIGDGALSIELIRAGQVPQRVWYLDGHPRRVTKAEYEHAFGADIR